MEVVRKYNQELKMLNNDDNSSSTATATTTTTIKSNSSGNGKVNRLTSAETQTVRFSVESSDRSTNTETQEPEYMVDVGTIRAKLFGIKFILDEVNDQPTKTDGTASAEVLLAHITAQVREIKADAVAKNNEIKTLKAQNSKLVGDVKQLKEAKLKLESLYKIKCKSDLNKSAQIKKLEIGYQIELIKFRNEFNSDLVRYLETKLLRKESLVNENCNQLASVLKMINQLSSEKDEPDSSCADAQSILMVNLKAKLESLKEPIKCLLNSNLFTQSDASNHPNQNVNAANHASSDLNMTNTSGQNTECKKIPLNLIVKTSNSIEAAKCFIPSVRPTN